MYVVSNLKALKRFQSVILDSMKMRIKINKKKTKISAYIKNTIFFNYLWKKIDYLLVRK